MVLNFLLNINILAFILQNNNFISNKAFLIFKIMFYLYVVCLLFRKKYFSASEYILFIFSIVILFVTKRLYISTLLLTAIFFDKKHYQKYYFMNFILISLLLIMVIILSKYGIIEDVVLNHTGIQTRKSLGFHNPNTAGIIFLLVRCAFYYLNYYKIKVYHFIIIGIFVVGLYLETYSRTTLLAFFFEILLFYIMKYKYDLIKKTIVMIPSICVIFTFLLSIYCSNSLLNKILSNRLFYSHLFLKSVSLKNFLFGDKNPFYLPLDNACVDLLHDYGVIVLIIILFLLTLGIKKILLLESESEGKKILFLFLVYLFYSISETVLFSPYYSFATMILINYSLLKREENKVSY